MLPTMMWCNTTFAVFFGRTSLAPIEAHPGDISRLRCPVINAIQPHFMINWDTMGLRVRHFGVLVLRRVSLATLFHVLMLYNIEGFNIWQIGLKVSRPSQED
jgi:hypothetical protein